MWLAWTAAPSPTLLGFLALSVLHFGLGDAEDGLAPSPAALPRAVPVVAYGALPILLPMALHPAEAAPVLAALAGAPPAGTEGVLRQTPWLLPPWAALTAAALGTLAWLAPASIQDATTSLLAPLFRAVAALTLPHMLVTLWLTEEPRPLDVEDPARQDARAMARGNAGGSGDGRGAPGAAQGPVVVFDTDCVLCSGMVAFVLGHERDRVLRFAGAWSDEGKALAQRHGYTQADLNETFLVLQDGRALTRSDAGVAVLQHLRAPWRWLAALLRLAPRPLRDAVYDFVARRRYRWFGRRQDCTVVPRGERHRFVGVPGGGGAATEGTPAPGGAPPA